MTQREIELQAQLEESKSEIIRLHNKLVDARLDTIETKVTDHETRVRSIELVATRSNVLFSLATGGGLVSLIVLLRTLVNFP